MLHALALAIGQFGDPRVLRLLAKSVAVTLLVFAVLGIAAWWPIDAMLAGAGLDDAGIAHADGIRGAFTVLAVLTVLWLAWRVIALAVLQFFADEVVEAVEARYYPAALASARPLGWRAELARGLRSALRAILWNLAALPFALALLVTGIGTALLFWAVNAVLIGRELMDMVWLRHRRDARARPPLSPLERFTLGGIVAGLLIVPLVNLLAPFLGAAAAAHLIHRKGAIDE